MKMKEKSIKAVIEYAGYWFWEMDKKCRYVYSNKNVKLLLGYTQKEIIGKRFYDFLIPEEKKILKKKVLEFISHQQPFQNLITKHLHKNGDVVILENTGIPFLENNELRYAGITIDITRHKIVEKELLDWLDTLDTFVGKFDLQGRMIFCNQAPLKAGGIKKDDVIGKYFPDTPWWSHSKEEREKIIKAFKRARMGVSTRLETSIKSASGDVIPIIFNCQPVMDRKGKVKFITAEGKIILQEKQLQERLQKEIGERKSAEEELKKKTEELEEKIDELERFNRLAVGRELKMIELKKRIKELEKKIKEKGNRNA